MKACWLIVSLLCTNGYGWTLEAQGLRGWQTNNLVINFNPTNCSVSESVLAAAIDQAAALWSGLASASIAVSRNQTNSATTAATFLAGTATDAPLIVCDTTFGTDLGVDSGAIPAATKLGTKNPLNYGAMILNSDSGAGAAIDVLSEQELSVVIAHEMGHLLGLGHSSSTKALMYYAVSGSSVPIVTQDDADGVAYLYPRSEFSNTALGCNAVHETHESPSRIISFFMMFLIGAAFCGIVRAAFQRGVVKPEPLPLPQESNL